MTFDKNKIIIIGAGGHGKVVLSTLLAANKSVLGFVDDDVTVIGKEILGFPVLGPCSLLKNHIDQAAIFGIGNNKLRMRMSAEYAHLHWETVVHPRAFVHESVALGEGTVICAGAVIQPDTKIGQHSIINTSSSVDHDCLVGDFTHLAPGTHVAGGVQIGMGCLLGIGSVVIPGMTIGNWTTLAAGSVVITHLDSHAWAKGVPAKIYKQENNNACIT